MECETSHPSDHDFEGPADEIKYWQNEILWSMLQAHRGYNLDWCIDYIIICRKRIKEIIIEENIDRLKTECR